MALEMTWGWEMASENVKSGYCEGLLRGYRGGLLTGADYNNLSQCENLDDVKLHLNTTDYAPYLANEPSPLHPATIVEKCTHKLVDEWNHLRCQAVEPLSTFLDYCTYGYMIDNVVLIVAGTLHEREMQDLLAKCHPLGMFDSIATLAVATTMRELYRLVLVDTPLAPYFSGCISSEDLDEMNVEVMRVTLYKAYLEDFAALCERQGGATAKLMADVLSFEADKRALQITINSLGTDLSREDRAKLFPRLGSLYPFGHAELAAADDIEQVRAAAEKVPYLAALFSRVPFGADATALDRAFYEEEVKRCMLMFELQFHYGVYWSYLKLREQEIRNLMWVSECVAQDQHSRVQDGIISTF